MNTPSRAALSFAIVAAFAAYSAPAGPIDPPAGPVAPTHKTLSEIEPRTPVSSETTPGNADSLYRIAAPGSYYLTGNLTAPAGRHAVEIEADNVTLDLMGFTISGEAGSLDGVSAAGVRRNLIIRNGVVSGCGSEGIDLINSDIGSGALVENIIASGNASYGIRVGPDAIVRGCAANANLYGIIAYANATLVNCVASENAEAGIIVNRGSLVVGCMAHGNTRGISTSDASVVRDSAAAQNTERGISAGSNALIASCTAHSNGEVGIFASSGAVTGCVTRLNGLHGIHVLSDTAVSGNMCFNNGLNGDGAGILAASSDNRIEDNTCTDNDWGIRVTSAGSFIARNLCSGSLLLNWDIAAGNKCLVVSAANAPAIAGSAGGVSPGSTDPNANYTY